MCEGCYVWNALGNIGGNDLVCHRMGPHELYLEEWRLLSPGRKGKEDWEERYRVCLENIIADYIENLGDRGAYLDLVGRRRMSGNRAGKVGWNQMNSF